MDPSVLWVTAVWLFVSCGAVKGPSTPALMFYGECTVQVDATPSGAKISVDGIPLGQNSVKVDIPCGQKSLVVRKDGHVTHESFPVVKKGQPLKLDVKLEPFRIQEDLAMSPQLLAMAREGKIGASGSAPGKAASTAQSPAAGAQADVPAASAQPSFDPNDVESWR